MIVERWGNTLALRLPTAVVEALELNEGDDVIVEVAGTHHFSIARKPAPADLIAGLKKFRGRLPADFHFDRLEANGR